MINFIRIKGISKDDFFKLLDKIPSKTLSENKERSFSLIKTSESRNLIFHNPTKEYLIDDTNNYEFANCASFKKYTGKD